MGIHCSKRPLKMQVDTGADSTVISSLILTEIGKTQLDGEIRRLEACNFYQLTVLGLLSCDVTGNGTKYRQKQLAFVQSNKKIELLGAGFLGMCRLPRGLKNSSTIFQN